VVVVVEGFDWADGGGLGFSRGGVVVVVLLLVLL